MKLRCCLILALASSLIPAHSASIEEVGTSTGATENKGPAWIKHGAYFYRVCTPDKAETLVSCGHGFAMTSHLLDGAVQQISLMNGVIGDDHPGDFNRDGVWPDFSDGGLAKQMLNEFYGNLPYTQPVLFVDVLILDGGNFSTGFPDGPQSGSKETQLEGVTGVSTDDYSKILGAPNEHTAVV